MFGYICDMIAHDDDIKYPVGIQNFSKLREEGFLYVDKTAYIHRLIKGGGYVFLSRPRRFGKSLLVSTIEAYYRGRRELFKGLAIDSLTDKWEAHPVFHLDLSNRNYQDESSVNKVLNAALELWENEYGDEKRDRDPEERFAYVIRRAYEQTGKRVVILVDEYDKPLLNMFDQPEVAASCRAVLKAFYANLKAMDGYIEFAMLTGVARFSKVSIFSDLNNLSDISFDDRFSGICGITGSELKAYFGEGIEELAALHGITREEMGKMLKKTYDGYHFSAKSEDIYNPFSLLSAFSRQRIRSYWFETGTPTYLVRLLHKIGRPFRTFTPIEIEDEYLETSGLQNRDPVPAFYQSGYLTIKSYDSTNRLYTLDYPNEEVKEGFLKFLLLEYIPKIQTDSGFSITDFIRYIRVGDCEGFMRSMESLIASIPYSDKGSAEAHFQNAVYLLFTLVGFSARMEERTSDGRIDILLTSDSKIYIFEFKVDGSAEKAMHQIREKKYWLPYLTKSNEIFLIGANFDTQTRRLDGYLIEKITQA